MHVALTRGYRTPADIGNYRSAAFPPCRYSEFINFDIYLYTSKEIEVDAEEEEEEEEADAEGSSEEEEEDEAAVEVSDSACPASARAVCG